MNNIKLYISYWWQVRNFPKNLVGLNTTVWPPKYRPLGKDNRGVWVLDCPPLKPGASCNNLCRGDCNPKHPHNCNFLQKYKQQLDAIDFNEFMTKLNVIKEKISSGEQLQDIAFAFIVFEAPNNPCSERVMIRKWFSEHDIDIQEWQKD